MSYLPHSTDWKEGPKLLGLTVWKATLTVVTRCMPEAKTETGSRVGATGDSGPGDNITSVSLCHQYEHRETTQTT